MNLLNKKIKNLPDYPFNRLRALLSNIKENKEVIDMSIGQPMHEIPSFVREVIYNEKDKWNSYPPVSGIPILQKSYLDWLKKRFEVDKFFDESNIIPLSGTKEGLFSIAMALNIKKNILAKSILSGVLRSLYISEYTKIFFSLKQEK